MENTDSSGMLLKFMGSNSGGYTGSGAPRQLWRSGLRGVMVDGWWKSQSGLRHPGKSSVTATAWSFLSRPPLLQAWCCEMKSRSRGGEGGGGEEELGSQGGGAPRRKDPES